jgi:hypothetical protein
VRKRGGGGGGGEEEAVAAAAGEEEEEEEEELRNAIMARGKPQSAVLPLPYIAFIHSVDSRHQSTDALLVAVVEQRRTVVPMVSLAMILSPAW